MTPTRRALHVLNRLRLSQSERNAVIRLAQQLAAERGARDVVPAWYVRDALAQLGLEREVRT